MTVEWVLPVIFMEVDSYRKGVGTIDSDKQKALEWIQRQIYFERLLEVLRKEYHS